MGNILVIKNYKSIFNKKKKKLYKKWFHKKKEVFRNLLCMPKSVWMIHRIKQIWISNNNKKIKCNQVTIQNSLCKDKEARKVLLKVLLNNNFKRSKFRIMITKIILS